jgi:hypothetical protein
MAPWFRRSQTVPQRKFDPAELSFPFTLPVISIADDGAAAAYRASEGLVTVSGHMAKRGEPRRIRVVDASLRAWRPTRLVAVCDTGRRLFGRSILFAQLEFREKPKVDMNALRGAVVNAIERDPDDIWDQIHPHQVLKEHARRAMTVDELVRVVRDLGGQGA